MLPSTTMRMRFLKTILFYFYNTYIYILNMFYLQNSKWHVLEWEAFVGSHVKTLVDAVGQISLPEAVCF